MENESSENERLKQELASLRQEIADLKGGKQSEEALKQSNELGDALIRINAIIHSTLDFDEIIRRVNVSAAQALGTEASVIGLLEGDQFLIKHAYNMPEAIIGSYMLAENLKGTQLAIQQGDVIAFNDAFNDERLNNEEIRKYNIRSLMIAPLISRKTVLGAIGFLYRSRQVEFGAQQIDFARKFAAAVSLALRNAQLFTERKESEERIRLLNEDLAAKNAELVSSNRELEAFVYSASHDLRAPLRIIGGFTDLVTKKYGDRLDEKGKEYLVHIRESSSKMAQLIDDLLKLTKISRGGIQKQTVDLSKMASSIIADLCKADPKRKVSVHIQGGITAYADEGLMELALSNLISNSWKFTSKKANAFIEIGTSEKEGMTVYYVRDNGVGFDKNIAEKVFWPFQRFHPSADFEGTGIGLAIAERIIRRHGGQIWAEAEVGKGASFCFIL
jgi:signal transduction histidine kinase